MKHYILIFSLVLTLASCSKTQTPPPSTNGGNTSGSNTGNNSGSTGNNSGGTDGSNNSDGSGGTGQYTTLEFTINTRGGSIDYDPILKKAIGSLTSNANGGGVQTTDGGITKMEITNLTDADISTIELDKTQTEVNLEFKTNSDPILKYTVTDDEKKEIRIYNVHMNKVAGANGSFGLIGNVLHGFKDNTNWNAAKLIEASKSSTQRVQHLAVK